MRLTLTFLAGVAIALTLGETVNGFSEALLPMTALIVIGMVALAPRLSLDPAATVFQLGGILATVAEPRLP